MTGLQQSAANRLFDIEDKDDVCQQIKHLMQSCNELEQEEELQFSTLKKLIKKMEDFSATKKNMFIPIRNGLDNARKAIVLMSSKRMEIRCLRDNLRCLECE